MYIYALYFYSMSSLLLAIISGMNALSKNKIIPWEYLSGFGITLFVYNWLDIVSWANGSSYSFVFIKNIILLSAFVFLLEFLRKNFIQMGKPIHIFFLFGIPAIILAFGLLFGLSVFYGFIRIFLAFGTTVLITFQIYLNIRKNRKFRLKFLPFPLSVLFFGFTFILVAPPEAEQNMFLLTASHYSDLFIIDIAYLRGIILFVIAAGVWNYLYYIRKKNYSDKDRKRKLIFGISILISTLLVQIAGWFVTTIYSDQALQNLKHENDAYMYFFNKVITDEFNLAENSVKGLSGSHWLHLALMKPAKQNFQKANAVLDRYKEALSAASLFVMDSTGKVIITSNRLLKSSHPRKQFFNLHLFDLFTKGDIGQYLYLNPSTGQRMLAVTAPMNSRSGTTLGVLVMERSLDHLLQNNVMGNGHICLVSPEGLIFVSDDTALIGRMLYPVSAGEKRRIQQSDKYGEINWEPILPNKIIEDQIVESGTHNHFVNRKTINKDGWEIVILGDTFQVTLYRFYAILLTLFITIILFVFMIIYFINQQRIRALYHSEIWLRKILEIAPEAIFVIKSEDERIREFNNYFKKMLGMEEDRILNLEMKTIFGDNYDSIKKKIKAIKHHEIVLIENQKIPRGDGLYIDVEGTCTTTRWDNKESIIFFIHDVSKSKQTLKELEENERKYRNLFDNASDAIILLYENMIFDCNVKAGEIFGVSPEEMIGRLPDRFLPKYQPDGKQSFEVYQNHMNLAQQGEAQRFECQYLRNNGSPFFAGISLNKVEVKGKLMVQAIIRDITEEKRLQHSLKDARDKALEAAKAKSEFLANMSHEIRTPMNGVIGMLDLLNETELTAEQRDYTKTAKISADSLLEIINDILDFSKIEAGKLNIDSTKVEIQTLIGSIGDTLAKPAHDKGLELICELDANLPYLIQSDPLRLRQILINLTNNAVKFTKSGEILLSCMVEQEDASNVWLRFSVKDTGIGIPKEKQKSIFGAFEQADGSTTRNFGGTGLGLAISKQLVEMMGGNLELDSEPGKGSEFYFSLPFEKDQIVIERRQLPVADISGKQVLIVDDNRTNQKVLLGMVKKLKMEGYAVSGGQEALDYIKRSGKVDVILLDVNMPEMDGREFLLNMKKEFADFKIKIIVLGSSGRVSDSKWFKAQGCVDYIIKPIKLKRLLEVLLAAFQVNTQIEKNKGRRATDVKKPDNTLNGIKVLLAEDNLINQKVATRILEKAGVQVVIAGDGLEVIERLKTESPQLILMDIQMPVMDGLETTRMIRREVQGGRKIPIIAMTAHAMKGDRDRCLAAGMNDYISKPINKDELLTKIVLYKDGLSQADQREKNNEAGSDREQSTA